MKGILWTRPKQRRSAARSEDEPLAPWEDVAVDAVGNVIEIWGFKRNQGRVWGLLYLRGEPGGLAAHQHPIVASMMVRWLPPRTR